MKRIHKKKTVGQAASDLIQKSDDMKGVLVTEIVDAQAKEYMGLLMKTVQDHKNIFEGPYFYIEVITRVHLANVFRNQFMARASCPTPYTDQTVYRYNRQAEIVEHLWSVPNSETCHHLMEFHSEAIRDVPELFSDVVRFVRGDLRKRSLELNGEESPKDAAIIHIVDDPQASTIIH